MTEKQYRAPMPRNTLTNNDGTPYSAGHDTSFGRIAYEAFVQSPRYQRMLKAKFGVFTPDVPVPWNQLNAQEQKIWEEVAQAVLAANEMASH